MKAAGNKNWQRLLVCVALVTGMSAQATICKMGKSERKVEVVTTDASKKVPCEVKYTRDGEEKTLWNAQADASYCETKASEFVAKLSSQGWKCDGAESTEGAAHPTESAAHPTESASPTPTPNK